MVLNTFRTGASWFEKCVLDEIAEDLIELDAKKFVEEQAEKPKPLWRSEGSQRYVSEDGGKTWTWCYNPDDLVKFCPMGYNPEQE